MDLYDLKVKQQTAWNRFLTCRSENDNPIDKRQAHEEYKKITTEIYNIEHPGAEIPYYG